MNTYTYQAALLCGPCGEKTIRELLGKPEDLPERGIVDCRNSLCSHRWNPTVEEYNDSLQHAGWFDCPKCEHGRAAFDEYAFDSDNFPKGPDGDGGGEADTAQTCDHCHTFLENPLTPDGYRSVQEMLNKHGAVLPDHAKEWAEFYNFEFHKQIGSAHEWLDGRIAELSTGAEAELLSIARELAGKLDSDTIQDIFQSDMDSDGYFKETGWYSNEMQDN